MKKIVFLFTIILFVGCGDGEPPVKVSKFEEYNPLLHLNLKFLSITSTADSVMVKLGTIFRFVVVAKF